MQIQLIKFEILNDIASFFINIYIDDDLMCQLECFDVKENIDALNDWLALLNKPIIKPVSIYLIDHYIHHIEFKLSPYPPYDWLILTLPVKKANNQIALDRMQFLESIKNCISQLNELT